MYMPEKKFEFITQHVTTCTSVYLFLEAYVKSLKLTDDIENAIIAKLQPLPWHDIYNNLVAYIKEEIDNLPGTLNNKYELNFPEEGLAGLYICLGDDGLSYTLCGSTYFNEVDWAANAEYYPDDSELSSYYNDFAQGLKNHLEVKPKQSPLFSEADFGELLFAFSSYVSFHCMNEIKDKTPVQNAGIVIGYSDGEELLLGNFAEGIFKPCVQVIDDTQYKKSTCKPIEITTSPREHEPYWDYISHNYRELLVAENIYATFRKEGEAFAKAVAETLSEKIFINDCKKCGNIKKTPRARLCLECGDFVEVGNRGV